MKRMPVTVLGTQILTGILTAAAPAAALTSLIAVIANPDSFREKSVELQGYLVMEFEHHALYLNKESATVGLSANGVWLDLEDNPELLQVASGLTGKFVGVVGTLDPGSKGPRALFAGRVAGITMIYLLPSQ
jgi:hypothetical protein